MCDRGITRASKFSAEGRPKGVTTEIATLDYEYDRVGNPTKIVRENGSTTYYSYDDIYQLTGEAQVDAQGAPIFEAEYDYDGAHNRTVKVVDGTPTYYSYNEANQLLTETSGEHTVYYHYDGCGNTIAKQEPSGTTYYHYDTENLMTRIDFADGGHSYYSYDADSKRVSQRSADGFRQFVYQGPDMLKLQMERDEAGETQVRYTMGSGLEAMRRDNASSFYHYNHLGTALALTGADEAVSDTYRHDAWGVLLESTGATVNPHTYVGRERYYRMPNAEMYHLGFRDYAQGIGRFVAVDPARAGRNWFRYADNNPLLIVDPRGLQGGWSRLVDRVGRWLANLPRALWLPIAGLLFGEIVGQCEQYLAHQAAEAADEVRQEFTRRFYPAWSKARNDDVGGCKDWCWANVTEGYDLGICLSGCDAGGEFPTNPPGTFEPDPVDVW